MYQIVEFIQQGKQDCSIIIRLKHDTQTTMQSAARTWSTNGNQFNQTRATNRI